jgi:hypothetical protein
MFVAEAMSGIGQNSILFSNNMKRDLKLLMQYVVSIQNQMNSVSRKRSGSKEVQEARTKRCKTSIMSVLAAMTTKLVCLFFSILSTEIDIWVCV